MKTYRVRMWTGPSLVAEVARRLSEAGFPNVVDGTEHVYWYSSGSDGEAAAWNAMVDVERILGRHGGWRVVPSAEVA